jgi:hypothetical protein
MHFFLHDGQLATAAADFGFIIFFNFIIKKTKPNQIKPPIKTAPQPKLHRMQTNLRDAMASRIQQRFWYARGRWNTAKRIGRRLLKAGLDLQAPSDIANALSSDRVEHQFAMWFRRLLPRGVEAPCMRSVLNSFGICAFKYDCVDRAYADSDRLIVLAEGFAGRMDASLRTPTRFNLMEEMDTYLSTYCDWVYANENSIREMLLQTAVSSALQSISHRTQRGADAEHDKCAKLSIFFGGIHAVRHFIRSSRELQFILSLKNSPFWGPGDTSVFRMMHETLMDERYVLSRDTVCVRFRTHYERVPPFRMAKFMQDLRAMLMFPLQDPPAVIEMVRTLDCNPSESELMAFADRLVPLIARAAPNPTASQHITQAWQECDCPTRVLGALRESAVSLRYAFALEELERCKRNVWRHGDGFHHTQVDILLSRSTNTKLTEDWIRRVLQGHAQLERLAAGDSFALLRFHDHEIIRFVLEGRFDTPLLVPEVLQFDIDRMRTIMCDGCPPEWIIHMVDTHDVPDGLPQFLKDSVVSLRRMVFVCRFQHGNCFADITQRTAKHMMLSKK